MERQFENRNLKLENCDMPHQKIHFSRKPNLPPTTPSVPPPRAKPSPNRPQTGLTPVFLPTLTTAALPTMPSVPPPRAKASPNRRQTALTPAFLPAFATVTLPTMPSVPSPRAKASPNRPQTGLTPVSLPVFATATLPTIPSVPSSRSHCELVHRIVAEMGFVKFTWHEPLLIIK